MTRAKTYKFGVSLKKIIILISVVVLAASLVLSADEISERIRNTMVYVVRNVVPALFPFMILSSVIVENNTLVFANEILGDLFVRFFRVNRFAVTSVLLGFCGGFPTGAAAAAKISLINDLPTHESERLIMLSHNTGPAFPVVFIGGALLNDVNLGLLIYVSQIIAWLILGLISKVLVNNVTENKTVRKSKQNSISKSLTNALGDSTLNCVKIVGTIVFWSFTIGTILEFLNVGRGSSAVILSIFELSSGCDKALELNGLFKLAVLSFAVGFGGVSSLMQAKSLSYELDVSFFRIGIYKFIQGILCSIISCVLAYSLKIGV